MEEFRSLNEEQDKKDDELRAFLENLTESHIIDLSDTTIDGIVERARTDEELREKWYRHGAMLRQQRSD